ncbi:hypothetical protein [Sutterella wadsworthensis]|uniref:hypothetical protein n=1 Tax=Sutterella wadsworthensis TaxID=40545 RepID=UPI0024329BA2|nr:hypothetical protein [Sutterella wadsworthensis]
MRSTNPGFVPDSPFTRELTAKQLAFFSAFPKAELHCHLLGTTSRETFIDLVRDSGAPIPMAEIEGFYTRGEKPVGVLRIFRALESSILKKPEYLKRITLEHLERTAAQGVRYIELDRPQALHDLCRRSGRYCGRPDRRRRKIRHCRPPRAVD